MTAIPRIIIAVGALSLTAGLLAILNPFAATIAAVTLAAFGLLMAGVGKALAAFEEEGRVRWVALLLAAALVALAAAVLFRPVSGAYALLLMVGTLLLVSGVAKTVWALSRRGEPAFWPTLIGGALSLLLAWLILRDLRAGAVALLGLLLGVELMLNGMVLLAVGAAARRLGRRVRDGVAARLDR